MLAGRLAIACGGTLGHVTPALAVADAWAKAHPGAPPLLITVRGAPLPHALVRSGHDHVEIAAGPVARSSLGGRVKAVLALGRGVREAREHLLREGIVAALSFGAYAGAPVILAARSLGLPAIFHEGNVDPGWSNRVAVAAGAIPLVAWPATRSVWPRADFVGFPVGSAPGIARFRVGERIEVVVTGGSEGSPDLDRWAPRLLEGAGPPARLRVLHQTGDLSAVAGVAEAYRALGLDAEVVPFVADLPAVFARSALAIACPGAATLAELAAASLPALLIPRLDVARRHQHANARAVADARAALMMDSDPEIPGAAAWVAALLADERRWGEASRAMGRMHTPDAARAVVGRVESALRPGRSGAPRLVQRPLDRA